MTSPHTDSHGSPARRGWIAVLAIALPIACNDGVAVGTSSDSTAPLVHATSPTDNVTGTAIHTRIAVAFSEAMSAASITSAIGID